MASIVDNQRRAYQAHAEDAAKVLVARLQYVSPAQQAAILASAAKNSGCPIDLTFTTGEREDALEAARILDGDLDPADDGSWSWKIGSGCSFVVDVTQADER